MPNALDVSNDIFILFRSEYRPPTLLSSPRIEFIIACNNALDADVSDVSAFSPSDAVFMAVAWAAVIPTTFRFSVNTVNCSPASRMDWRDSANLYTRLLQEHLR